MYEFLDRLITVALPRVRDFRGVSGAQLRRARQLCARAQGAARLSRDRLRPGRRGARHGYRHRHHRQDRCRSQGAAQGLRHAVRQLIARGDSILMAKKSSIEKNARRAKLAKQINAAPRAAQGARARPRRAPPEDRFEAQLKLAELPRNSSQTRGAQPLRADRPAARLLPQVQAVAHRGARARLVRADPGHGQVELVREASR